MSRNHTFNFNRICRGNGFYYYAQRTVHPLLQWCAVLQHGSDGDRQTAVWRYLDIVDNLYPVTIYTISQSREEQLEYLLATAAEIGTFSRYVDIRTVSNLTI